ncbi:type I secretion system permease/ATPase [Aliishimia ponticola]|uniref:Type I secretion system permease/ATPase n=1 Tax=Aliishimia ponticola TaxID=2499833 RepID=A0A4S4NC57_9RHOB|nr:type I secretion system permease/ATPase [Aliishimia ponticola]THH37006.1 type I secretion system permease/ATPase [Aliishimia ponticola]
MQRHGRPSGKDELRAARKLSRGLYWAVGIFSFFANLLMLTGPLYMLQVYDRVLGSRSEETLIALSLLVVFLYGIMGLMEFVRGRVMGRAGARFQSALDKRVFEAVSRKAALAPDQKTESGLQDLESLRRLMTAPVLMAIFDMPWTPIFLAGIFIFHPLMGWLAVLGGSLLILITVFNQMLSRGPNLRSNMAEMQAGQMSGQMRTEAEMLQSMGMEGAAYRRWNSARTRALEEGISAADVGGGFSAMTKALRLFLQSAMLGLGAWLTLQGELTPGAMIAGSILLGRALAPIELAVGQWALVQRAAKGWENLSELLDEVPPREQRTALPRPRARLEAKNLTVLPPGERQASLKSLNFVLEPGQAMGVIGPSGCGKSTLARAITGLWRPAGGSMRLDGAALDQYEPEVLGGLIGYLPQRVQLFDGTIAENIARLADTPDDAKVVAAAKKAAAHQMILDLPNGYDTVIRDGQSRLSGGQIQRIGLARALYADPVIVVLDEPNSNLDNVGNQALNQAIRQLKSEDRSVMIMAHRPNAIQECDTLLVMENGMRMAFGPKDEVLKATVRNHKEVAANPADKGGVV